METKDDGYVVINERTCFAVHPGEILQAELKERKIKQKDFARSIGMQPSHLSALIHGVRSVTPAIAAKLEKGLGIPASLWNNFHVLDARHFCPIEELRHSLQFPIHLLDQIPSAGLLSLIVNRTIVVVVFFIGFGGPIRKILNGLCAIG